MKKIVDDHVWQQLTQLWLTAAAKNETFLITENSLFKLLENDSLNSERQQLKADKPTIERFFLLITPQFNAFLRQEPGENANTYQVSVVFDRKTIIAELTQLVSNLDLATDQTWLNQIQTHVFAKLTVNSDNSDEFALKAVKLLINSIEYDDRQSSLSTTPMEKLLRYQVEQERIFDQIKIQISQNLNLSEIIQTTISHSRSLLELDRLLIYQLNVPLESNQLNSRSASLVDTITYEARKNDQIASTLYHQSENCWHESQGCRNKYYQGFSLVIDDVDASTHLNPCLQELMAKFQVKAKVVMPIKIRDNLWGLIIAHQCLPRTWHHQDVQFLRQITEYIAIAIYNHQSYQQLHHQKQLLEKQVQMQAQQLKDALIAAEAASKSKHDFLGSMSHELRTPLTCVIGLSSTLLQWSSTKERISLPPEKQQEYLHLIQQSGRHLLALINNILEFSDVESGKHLLNIQQLSLSDVVKHSLQLLQESAAQKEIALYCQIEITPDQDYFFADEVRLKEILFHIISNGIKFTPAQGEVVLRVWREKHQVVFQIEDTGIGIAPSEIPILFEKFKQIENFRRRVHGGTGLGLALTKKLIELHGGTIEIESEVGQGSIFTVYLPETTPPTNSLVRTNATPYNKLDSRIIVLVSEDDASATFICQLLNTIQYQVVWLTDSAMAIDQIELLQPRIVIIDQDCSVMDVKNVINAIAHTSMADDTKVALLGDRFEHKEWQKFTDCGVDEYLLKSMNPTEIINKISNLSLSEYDQSETN
ncbi:MAG: ATP-binding protein [Cyanobacteria bacterium P01_G01_bin.39]